SAPASLDEVHKDLLQLSGRVDALSESLKAGRKPAAEYPTLEQMNSARADVDWKFVDEVRDACRTDPAAGLDRVRLMTFDDLLRKVGAPGGIHSDGGAWWYARSVTDSRGQTTMRGILLHFMRVYV